jgi:hypothetical protein
MGAATAAQCREGAGAMEGGVGAEIDKFFLLVSTSFAPSATVNSLILPLRFFLSPDIS